MATFSSFFRTRKKIYYFHVKPWPNGLASRRKLKTLVCLWPRLARACERTLWSRSNLNASRWKLFTVWPPNPSWVTSINVLLANEIHNMSALQWVFWDLQVLVRELACPLGHPTQVSTQDQLATTWLLATTFGQGFKTEIQLVLQLKGAQSQYFELFWASTKLPLNWRKPENNTFQR